MQIFLLILFGFLSGVVGGMGMGGGTLLVPLLSFSDMPQKAAQSANLVSFLPMCCVALIFHVRHGLVEKSPIGWMIVPALVFAVVGALVADVSDNAVLRICYAVFLLGVGLWQMAVAVRFEVKQRKQKRLLRER